MIYDMHYVESLEHLFYDDIYKKHLNGENILKRRDTTGCTLFCMIL